MMKNKKKIIAIVVAVVLVASIFVVSTVANTKTTSIDISINKTELSAGETATVTVKVSANYPVAVMSIPVFFDKTLVDVSNPTAPLTSYAVHDTTTDSQAENLDKVFANTGLSSSKYGFVLATYIGGANATVSTLENATVLTFTITAKTSVSGSAIIKCASGSAKTETNVDGTLYFGATTSGNQITSIPENVEGVNLESASASVNIVGGSPTLVAKSGKDTAFDNTNKYIYGITPGTSVNDYITVDNGSYELVTNAAGKTNGTGAKVKIKNASGAVIDTYTVIIFGDVNGDSNINDADKALLNLAILSNSTGNLNDAQIFASDLDANDSIDDADKAKVNLAILSNSTSSVPTNPYA